MQKCTKRRGRYPCGLDRYDQPKMGKEYHRKVNRHITKYGAKDPAQSGSLASEPDDVNNDRGNRDGIY